MQVNAHHLDKDDRLLTSYQILFGTLTYFVLVYLYCSLPFYLVIGVKAQFFIRLIELRCVIVSAYDRLIDRSMN